MMVSDISPQVLSLTLPCPICSAIYYFHELLDLGHLKFCLDEGNCRGNRRIQLALVGRIHKGEGS